MKKRLTKSDSDRVFTGVLGGIGEYAGVDSTLIRVLYVLATVFTGFMPGVIGYIAAAVIMPQAAHSAENTESAKGDDTPRV